MPYVILQHGNGEGWIAVNENAFNEDQKYIGFLYKTGVFRVNAGSYERSPEGINIPAHKQHKFVFDSPFSIMKRLEKTLNNKAKKVGDNTWDINGIGVVILDERSRGLSWKFAQ